MRYRDQPGLALELIADPRQPPTSPGPQDRLPTHPLDIDVALIYGDNGFTVRLRGGGTITN